MLVLSRKIGEEIIIDDHIRLTVVAVQNGQVRLGITAPKDVHILRAELQPKLEVDADLERILAERAKSISCNRVKI